MYLHILLRNLLDQCYIVLYNAHCTIHYIVLHLQHTHAKPKFSRRENAPSTPESILGFLQLYNLVLIYICILEQKSFKHLEYNDTMIFNLVVYG